MFTGLVNHVGTLINTEDSAEGKKFWIACDFNDLILGESIAVDGICLTVTDFSEGKFSCDISPETLNLTRAGQLKRGDKINLERALRLSDRIGGHFVTGHVDQVAELKLKEMVGDYLKMVFAGIEKSAKPFFVKKGSVAINGVSLTLNEITSDGFEVMLIPQTLAKTNLGDLQMNDKVNIEYDFFAKLIVNYMQQRESGA